MSSQPVIEEPIPLFQEPDLNQEQQLLSEQEQQQLLERILEQRLQEPEQDQQDQQDPPIHYRPKVCPSSKSLCLDYINPTKIQGQNGAYIYRPRPLLEDAPKSWSILIQDGILTEPILNGKRGKIR
ncbi:hypothetical protein RCL1_005617 [Eukaryota sp. TZLM3-RCL]